MIKTIKSIKRPSLPKRCSRYTSEATVKNGAKINNIEGLAQVCAMLSNAAYHYPKKSFPHIINYIFNIKGVDDVIASENMLDPLPEPTKLTNNIKGGMRGLTMPTIAKMKTALQSKRPPLVEGVQVDPNNTTPPGVAVAHPSSEDVRDLKKQVNEKGDKLQEWLTPKNLAIELNKWSREDNKATAQTMALLANKGFYESLKLFYGAEVPKRLKYLKYKKWKDALDNYWRDFKDKRKCNPLDTSITELKKTHDHLFADLYKIGLAAPEGETKVGNKYWVNSGDDAFRIGGDINYVYIGTHLDLNLYVVYHKTRKKLFVIFRGTNSGISIAEDMKTSMTRISEDDLKTSQYHSDVWEQHWTATLRGRKFYYKKKDGLDHHKYTSPDDKEENFNNPLGEVSPAPSPNNPLGEVSPAPSPWTSGGLTDKKTIHSGFFEQSRYMFKRVVEAMNFLTKEVPEKEKEGIDVIYTGHSLGGAHAYIFSYFITTNRDKINLPFLNNKKVYVITWGSPRVGGKTWYNAYMNLVEEGKIEHRRYKTDADGFTTSFGPPTAKGYKQLGDTVIDGWRRVPRKKATVCSKKSGFLGLRKYGALQCMEMIGQCTIGPSAPIYAHLSQASIDMYGSEKTMGSNYVKKNNHLFVYSVVEDEDEDEKKGLTSKTVFTINKKPQQNQGGGLSKRKYRKKRTLRKKNKKSHRTLRKKNKKYRKKRTLRKKNKKPRRTLRKRKY